MDVGFAINGIITLKYIISPSYNNRVIMLKKNPSTIKLIIVYIPKS